MSNVHTWAMFFLRHLANMSCMVPFWASTGSGSVPIWGARVRSHAVLRRLFIVLITAAHISSNVFSLWKFLSNIQGLFLTVHSNIIHTYYTYITFIHRFTSFILYVLFTYSLLRIFMAGWLPSAPCVGYIFYWYKTVMLIPYYSVYACKNNAQFGKYSWSCDMQDFAKFKTDFWEWHSRTQCRDSRSILRHVLRFMTN
jgi:hypothetical protein